MLSSDGPCPGWYAGWNVAAEAERARRWWERGQLPVLYPGGITAHVIAAVEAADEEYRRWRAEGERRLRKQMEDEAKHHG